MNLKQLTFCIALGLAGCPAKPLEIDSSTSAVQITKDTDALAEAIAQSVGFVGSSATIEKMNHSSPVETAQPSRDAADWLKQHLINSDHVNASLTTSTDVFFCAKTDDFCDNDPKCDQALAAQPVCIKVQSFAEGEFDLALVVGPKQELNPFNLHLKDGYAKLETRLTDLRSAYVAFVTAAGSDIPESFPTRLDGRFSLELTRVTDRSVSAAVAVLDPIAVDVYPTSDARHVEVRLAASSPLWSILADGDQKRVEADLGMKGLDLLLPAQDFFGSDQTVGGQFLLHLDGAGYQGLFDAAASDESISLKGLTLGDATSKVQYRDTAGTLSDIAKLDLNAALGRTVDLTITERADGTEIKVNPGLELLLDHDLRALAASLPNLKGAALKAISHAKLSGADAAILIGNYPKVESGTLDLDATGMLDGQPDVHLAVAAGQCLVDATTAPPADSHPFAAWVSGTCQP